MARAQRSSPASSVDPKEVEKFSALADEWWNPAGSFAPLHKFNPVRLASIREQALAHFSRSGKLARPFEGLTLLDIGSGGGLLAEPMSRLGFAVTGADPAERNVEAARLHAQATGLSIDYRCSEAESLAEERLQFDVLLNMEVVEHVADLEAFLATCAQLVRPGGMMVVATINKTLKSLALAKIGAEYVLSWVPRGTHDWSKFVPPSELKRLLERFGLEITATQGVSFDPLAWDWRLGRDTDVNYMMVATKPPA